MSAIYIVEPPTSGKVVLVTSKGDVEIELWCKECPRACRNFIGLGMEGYYDGTIFHRVVPGFIIQGGDPTGTGHGGESIYGKTFKDEIHQRLKFTRRGLLGMANADRHDNGSQFFITLDRADELDKKHTLFGKVVGDTIFNVVKMGEVPLDSNERPLDPIVIKRMDIVDNPFDDLVPRPEVLAEKKALREADEARTKRKARSKVKAIKNFSLVSFGDEAEAEEAHYVKRKGMKSSHKLLTNDPMLKAEADSEDLAPLETAAAARSRPSFTAAAAAAASLESETVLAPVFQNDNEDLEFDRAMREKLLQQRPGYVSSGAASAASAPKQKIAAPTSTAERVAAAREEEEQLRSELRAAKKESKRAKLAEEEAAKAPESAASAFLAEQRAKYAPRGASKPSKAVKGKREEETLALLGRFKSKLFSSAKPTAEGEGSAVAAPAPAPATATRARAADERDPTLLGSDDEDDADWMAHALTNEAWQRPKGIEPEKDPYSLELHDPRHPMNIRRREESKNSGKRKGHARSNVL